MSMSAFGATRPSVSSPLAGPPQSIRTSTQTRPFGVAFPTSRAPRPFLPTGKKPKIIQPPANHQDCFMLDLTQAEFSRR
ncbi:hypothetical protein C8F01DRAFT_1110895 [Mycena amicta]|nr:hypothetical protein C8F01DRAFT_1110895 [Mycena amicta]